MYKAIVNQSTRDFAAERGLHLIDIEHEFRGSSDLFYDEFHLNDHGAMRIGDYVGESLQR